MTSSLSSPAAALYVSNAVFDPTTATLAVDLSCRVAREQDTRHRRRCDTGIAHTKKWGGASIKWGCHKRKIIVYKWSLTRGRRGGRVTVRIFARKSGDNKGGFGWRTMVFVH